MAQWSESEPYFFISIAAKMAGVHAQTLRYYERAGLVSPSRSRGNMRIYSEVDVNRVRQIQRLINDLGVNLAGVEVILRMGKQMIEMDREIRLLKEELNKLSRPRSVP